MVVFPLLPCISDITIKENTGWEACEAELWDVVKEGVLEPHQLFVSSVPSTAVLCKTEGQHHRLVVEVGQHTYVRS